MRTLLFVFLIFSFLSCSKETEPDKKENIINFYNEFEFNYEASAITIIGDNQVLVAGWENKSNANGIFLLRDSNITYIDSTQYPLYDPSLKKLTLRGNKLWFNEKYLISYIKNSSIRVNWNISDLENKRKSSQFKTDKQGILWEASDTGLIMYHDKGLTTYFNGNSFWGICFDKNNFLYVSTLPKMDEKGVIIRFDYNKWDTVAICSQNSKWIPAMCFDNMDNLWFGVLSRWSVGKDAGDGLYRIDKNSVQNYNIWNSGLSSNSVVDIDIDNYGNKWIATYSGGLVKFDNNGKWKVYNPENSGIGRSTVDYIFTKDNQVWFSVEFCGLSLLNPED
jgi:ligand-binding sensor domain-containing protein